MLKHVEAHQFDDGGMVSGSVLKQEVPVQAHTAIRSEASVVVIRSSAARLIVWLENRAGSQSRHHATLAVQQVCSRVIGSAVGFSATAEHTEMRN